MFNIKNTFALFLVAAALAAPSVSAGSVRGVFKNKEVGAKSNSNTNRHRRHLAEDKDNKDNGGGGGGGGGGGNGNGNNDIDPVTTTEAPVAASVPVVVVPIPAPVPSGGVALLISQCNTGNLRSCVGEQLFDMCTRCIYSQTTLSSTSLAGVSACGSSMCNGCISQAKDLYNCGKAGVAAVPAPVADPVTPVVVPDTPVVTPVVTPFVNVTQATTSVGCPVTLPTNGDSCEGLIPAAFLFHNCVYSSHTCSCRQDAPNYLCFEKSAAVPVNLPANDTVVVVVPANDTVVVVVPANPVTAAPVSAAPISAPTSTIITEIAVTTTCLSRLPTSGLTTCNLAPGAVCCHGVQISAATVCTCDESGLFQCSPGIPSMCPDDQNPNVIQPILPSN